MFVEPTYFTPRLNVMIERALIAEETEFELQGYVVTLGDFINLDGKPTAVKTPKSDMMKACTMYAVAMNNRVRENDALRKSGKSTRQKTRKAADKKTTKKAPAKRGRKKKDGG